MPRKPKAVETPVEAAPGFRISMNLGGTIYRGEGNNSLEALLNLEQPKKIFLKAVVTLEANGKSKTFPLMPIRARRYFQRIAIPYLAKELDIIAK